MSKVALLASYGKDEPLLKLGRLLQKEGWDLLGSAGTAKFLGENGVPCRDVAEIIGAPILGHRVVTLSREIHAALLSRDEDAPELERLHVPRIDLVYVTLYPLTETIAAGASDEEVLEKTDMGGPALLRSAAKGRRITLSSPAQIDTLQKWMEAGSPETAGDALVVQFAAAAERKVSQYTDASAAYWEGRVK